MTSSKLGRKEFIWLTLPLSSPSLKEGDTGTQTEQELMAETVGEYGLLACSARFLRGPRTTRPGMGSPTMSWALLPQSLI